jgi:hypothetical protein
MDGKAMKSKEMQTVDRRKAPSGSERRKDRRYSFNAPAQLIEVGSKVQIDARVRDIGRRGCFVETVQPFPLGTLASVSITSEGQSFNAQGKVVSILAGKGMGVFFAEVGPDDLHTLEAWISAKLEASWLDSNRRKSQRILMRAPVRVSGKSAANAPLEEETYTEMINAHGALIQVSATMAKGQKLTLENPRTEATLECMVVFVDRRDPHRVGVSFVMPCPDFWQVSFPPPDWSPRNTDAKQS